MYFLEMVVVFAKTLKNYFSFLNFLSKIYYYFFQIISFKLYSLIYFLSVFPSTELSSLLCFFFFLFFLLFLSLSFHFAINFSHTKAKRKKKKKTKTVMKNNHSFCNLLFLFLSCCMFSSQHFFKYHLFVCLLLFIIKWIIKYFPFKR